MGRLEDAAAAMVARNRADAEARSAQLTRAVQESQELCEEFLQVARAREFPVEVVYRQHAEMTKNTGRAGFPFIQGDTSYEETGLTGWIIQQSHDEWNPNRGTLLTPSGEFWEYSNTPIHHRLIGAKPKTSYFFDQLGYINREMVLLQGERLEDFTMEPGRWEHALMLYMSWSSK